MVRLATLRCPHCNHKLLQKSGDTTRLRTRGQLVFSDAGCKTQCYWCKSDVDIPVRLEDPPLDGPRFVLRRK